MFGPIFYLSLIWTLVVFAGWRFSRYREEIRHSRMIKEAMDEELKAVRAESISTPGGLNVEVDRR